MDPEKITSYDVSVAASKGDALAKRIYDFTGKMLGEACANFAAFSAPEAFVFFGGLTKAGDLLMKPLKEAYDKNVLKIYKGKAKFLVSTLDGSSAAVLGAGIQRHGLLESCLAAGYLHPRVEYWKILLYGMAPELSYRFRTCEEDVWIQREASGNQHHQYGEQQCLDLCVWPILSD